MLPDAVTARVSMEQGATLGWARYVGRHGHSIGMETFGASAPLKELQKEFGFVLGNIIEAARAQIARGRGEPMHVAIGSDHAGLEVKEGGSFTPWGSGDTASSIGLTVPDVRHLVSEDARD